MTREEFKTLFDRHFKAVRNYIYYRSGDAELATDIAQDTFMRVWEKQLVIEPDKTIGLLFKIASDLFVSSYRRESLSTKFKNSVVLSGTPETPDQRAEYNELSDKYEHALATMGENQRVVFLLSRVEGLKYNEIADQLQLSVKAVEKRMSQALDYFREKLLV